MDIFALVWLAAMAFAVYWQASWGWRAVKTGVATYYFHYRVKRDDKPFEFRMLVLGRAVGFLVAVTMFFFGLNFFGN